MATILIVDDSKTSRKVLKNLLETEGHTIIGEAKDGEEGITLYKELHPDITTMDITMPVLDGLEALKQIIEFDANAKVIMVTAAGQKNKMLESLKLGASEFLAKPFEPEQITTVIHKILEA
jgi:two-component system chemotaxis response regulator CheY